MALDTSGTVRIVAASENGQNWGLLLEVVIPKKCQSRLILDVQSWNQMVLGGF